MPYAIKRQNGQFLVVNKQTGRVMGRFDSVEKAKKQLAALYANVKETMSKEQKTAPVSLANGGQAPMPMDPMPMPTDMADKKDYAIQLRGATEAAREKSILHKHDFIAQVNVDDNGGVTFDGGTGESSNGPKHQHKISAMVSNPEQTEFQIETEPADDGDAHTHLIKIVLKEPIATPTDKVNEVPSDYSADINGLVFFDEGFDGRRTFSNSTLAFCSAIPQSFSQDNKTIKVNLTENGLLKHEIIRTGEYDHPRYGKISVTKERLDELKSNFDKGVLGQKATFNIHHQPVLGALGVHEQLSVEPKKTKIFNTDGTTAERDGFSLYAFTRLTPFGYREIVQDGKYLYTSAEIVWDYTDPEKFSDDEDGDVKLAYSSDKKRKRKFQSVLLGSAATNIPFIPRLEAFAASTTDVRSLYDKIKKEYKDLNTALKDIQKELNKRGVF